MARNQTLVHKEIAWRKSGTAVERIYFLPEALVKAAASLAALCFARKQGANKDIESPRPVPVVNLMPSHRQSAGQMSSVSPEVGGGQVLCS